MTDEGGSSGRLRRDLGMLPPGDIRNCLAALADDEDLLTRLFQYRFANGHGLTGHSFGNLFLAALTGITGDFYQAVLTAEQVLSVRGKILPATLEHVRLRGRGRSGRMYHGEVAVGRSGEGLESLELVPAAPAAFPGGGRGPGVGRSDPARSGLALHLDPAQPADSRASGRRSPARAPRSSCCST